MSGRIATAGALYAGAEVASRAALFLALGAWASVLEPGPFGVLELLRAAIVVIATPIGLGLSAAAGRWYVSMPSDAFARFLGTATLAVLATGAVATLTVVCLPEVVFAGTDASQKLGWTLAVLGGAAFALHTPVRSTLVVKGAPAAHAISMAVQAVASVGLGTAALAAGRGAIGVLGGYVAGLVVSVVVTIALGRRELRWTFDRPLLRDGLVFGLPLIPHLLAHHVMTYADRWMLMREVGDVATGLYSAAYLPASAATVLCLALSKATLGRVYRASDRAVNEGGQVDPDWADRLSRVFTGWFAIVSTLAVGGAIVGPPVLELLFDDAYAPAADLVPWLIWGTALHGLYLVPVNTLLFHRRTRLISSMSIASAVLNVALNAVLIPRYGTFGAAAATIAAYAVLSLSVTFAAQRHLGGVTIAAWARRAGWVAAGGTLTWACISASPTPLVQMVVGVVAAAVFGAAAWFGSARPAWQAWKR